MPEEIKPTTETVVAPAQSAAASVTPAPVVPAEQDEEPFDKARAMETITKLREIEKQAKAEKKELERLKAEEQKRNDANLSETERLKKQADELTQTNAKLQAEILRRDVVTETGLPAALADRLKGTTKEEMLEDAKALMAVIPQPDKPKPPHLNATNPGQLQEPGDEQKTRAWLNGASGNPFDKAVVKQKGGGVFGG